MLVAGEAGIGKTALVRAFCAGVEGRVLRGACDALHTPRPLGPLLDILGEYEGDPSRDVRHGPRRATRANPAGLTPPELEVLGLVAEGLRNAQIADRLVLAPKTVDHHVSALLRKLGVHTRTEAVTQATRLGVLGR